LKLAADQGNADSQLAYGFCLPNSEDSSIDFARGVHYFKHRKGPSTDLTTAAHFFKLDAYQNHLLPSDAQNALAPLLWDGRGIPRDLIAGASYFRLAADNGVAEAQYCYGIWLLACSVGDQNIEKAARYLKLSAETGNPDGQFVVAGMAENGIGIFDSVDLDLAVRNYERCSDLRPARAACFAWCLQTGRGIPIDFTVAAEFFKKAADSNDANGLNGFGCCLERGEGVDPDIDRAISYYRSAATLFHPDALYNFGRCREYGRGIDRDLNQAVKYYRLAAEMNNPAAQNSFGICLERGTGVHKNQSLAAQFYRLAAEQGHSDGANNFGFCLEHGRGVRQNIEMAAEYYRFAVDHGHPEAKLNHARCMRLLGRWEPPDRSAETVSHSPSADNFRDFIPKLELLVRKAGNLSVPFNN
jgi:TPR repeat protein